MVEWTLLIGLATYRLWRLVAEDNILDGPRDRLYDRVDGPVSRWFADMVSCVWCLGFWIAGGMTATAALAYDWDLLVSLVVWVAASAVAGFAGRLDPSS